MLGALISIHALRKESDDIMREMAALGIISIHALRKESDLRHAISKGGNKYFNPRSP